MPDYMTTVTAEECIPNVDAETVLKLCQALGYEGDTLPAADACGTVFISSGDDGYSVDWDPKDRELYICAEDNATTDSVPQKFWDELAKLLVAKKKDYLEFGWAAHCSKPCAGSYGGGEFRLYRDGQVVYPDVTYPKRKLPKLPNARKQLRNKVE